MAINEVFPNPTVKKVIFQILYPNLFYIENKIGDFQLEIMKEFPKSTIRYKQHFIIADSGPDAKIENFPEPEKSIKIWSFESTKKVKLNITTDSLDISSESHKTYNNEGSDYKFREIIEYVVERFLKVIKIPIFNRIGLRYLDDCPLPTKLDNSKYGKYYNTTFPLKRFPINEAQLLQFHVLSKKDNHYLRFVEEFRCEGGKDMLILDFDAFSNNIQSREYLKISDILHEIISNEYEKSLKEPVYNIMRNED